MASCLVPRRARRAEVEALLERMLDAPPAAMWEALATHDLIPMDWIDDPARRFVEPVVQVHLAGLSNERVVQHLIGQNGTSEGRVVPMIEGERLLRADLEHVPPFLHACPQAPRYVLAMASDVPGVLAAEALAREALARLAPWDAPRPAVASWRFGEGESWRSRDDGTPFWPQMEAVARSLRYRQNPLDMHWLVDHPSAPLRTLLELGYALESFDATRFTLFAPTEGLP